MRRHPMGDAVNCSQLLALSAVSAPSAFSNCVFKDEFAVRCIGVQASWVRHAPCTTAPTPRGKGAD